MNDQASSVSRAFNTPLPASVLKVATFTGRVCFSLIALAFASLQWVHLSRPTFASWLDQQAVLAGFPVFTSDRIKVAIGISAVGLIYALLRRGPIRGMYVVLFALAQIPSISPNWSRTEQSSPVVWGVNASLVVVGFVVTLIEVMMIVKKSHDTKSADPKQT